MISYSNPFEFWLSAFAVGFGFGMIGYFTLAALPLLKWLAGMAK